MKYESHSFTSSFLFYPQTAVKEIMRRHGVKHLPYVINIQKHIKLFCLLKQRTLHSRFNFVETTTTELLQLWDLNKKSEMNGMFNSWFLFLFSFCAMLDAFHSNCYQNKSLLRLSIFRIFWWTSSFFFISLWYLFTATLALRLWESFTFNVYFCWKEKKKTRKIIFCCWFMFSWKVWFLFPQERVWVKNVETLSIGWYDEPFSSQQFERKSFP